MTTESKNVKMTYKVEIVKLYKNKKQITNNNFKKLNLKKNFILLLTSHLMSGENFLKELNEFISWGKYKLNSGNKWNVLL